MKGIWPVKTERWGAGVVICLERDADLHMAQLMPLPLTVSCFRKIQIGFTFLVPAHPDSPGKRAIKRVCVCVSFSVLLLVALLLSQVPPITDYNVSDGQTYRYLHDDPLYPFGYGLSYSQFHYSDLVLHSAVIIAGQNVTVDVSVTNLGPYEADEVSFILYALI